MSAFLLLVLGGVGTDETALAAGLLVGVAMDGCSGAAAAVGTTG